MKKRNSPRRAAKKRIERDARAARASHRIDAREIAAVGGGLGVKRGLFYRPVKQQLTLRIDADVVAWFRAHAPKGVGYQSDMNRALREYVRKQNRKVR